MTAAYFRGLRGPAAAPIAIAFFFFLLVFLLVPLALPGPPSRAQGGGGVTIITGPTNITRPGYYELAGDISCAQPSGIAIGVLADNVVLNGSWHQLRGCGDGTGIYIRGDNVTVVDLTVLNYTYGVRAFGDYITFDYLVVNSNFSVEAAGSHITLNNTWDNYIFAGPWFAGGYGINVSGSYIVMRNVSSTSRLRGYGIVVSGDHVSLAGSKDIVDNNTLSFEGNYMNISNVSVVAVGNGTGVRVRGSHVMLRDVNVTGSTHSYYYAPTVGINVTGTDIALEGSTLLDNNIAIYVDGRNVSLVDVSMYDNLWQNGTGLVALGDNISARNLTGVWEADDVIFSGQGLTINGSLLKFFKDGVVAHGDNIVVARASMAYGTNGTVIVGDWPLLYGDSVSVSTDAINVTGNDAAILYDNTSGGAGIIVKGDSPELVGDVIYGPGRWGLNVTGPHPVIRDTKVLFALTVNVTGNDAYLAGDNFTYPMVFISGSGPTIVNTTLLSSWGLFISGDHVNMTGVSISVTPLNNGTGLGIDGNDLHLEGVLLYGSTANISGYNVTVVDSNFTFGQSAVNRVPPFTLLRYYGGNLTIVNTTLYNPFGACLEADASDVTVVGSRLLYGWWDVYMVGDDLSVSGTELLGAKYGIYVVGSHVTLNDDNISEDGYGGVNMTGDYLVVENSTFFFDWGGIPPSGYGVYLNGSHATIAGSNFTDDVNDVVIVGDDVTLANSTLANTVFSLAGQPDSFIARYGVGLVLVNSTGDLVYNNVFNNSRNVVMVNSEAAFYVSPRPGTNIVGGLVIAGNAWLSPFGGGFSQVTPPLPFDPYLCDAPYVNGSVVDLYPLRYPAAAPARLYRVTFTESGLPPGIAWSVNVNGTTVSSNSTSITLLMAAGEYYYSVGAVQGYEPSPPSGVVGVAGPAAVTISFTVSTTATTTTNTAPPPTTTTTSSTSTTTTTSAATATASATTTTSTSSTTTASSAATTATTATSTTTTSVSSATSTAPPRRPALTGLYVGVVVIIVAVAAVLLLRRR